MIITRKTRISMLVLILIVLVLLMYWVWILLRPQASQPVEEPIVVTPSTEVLVDEGPSPQELIQQQAQVARQESSSVTTVAKVFVERYGSYSNEAQFQNLTDRNNIKIYQPKI